MTKTLLILPFLVAALAAGAARADGDGDARAGFKVFKKCYACHRVKEGESSQVGPNLHGLFGRQAGTGDFKRYSEAMKNADIVWNEDTLAAYLHDPQAVVPDNKMAFPGLKKDADVRDLIAYLKRATR